MPPYPKTLQPCRKICGPKKGTTTETPRHSSTWRKPGSKNGPGFRPIFRFGVWFVSWPNAYTRTPISVWLVAQNMSNGFAKLAQDCTQYCTGPSCSGLSEAANLAQKGVKTTHESVGSHHDGANGAVHKAFLQPVPKSPQTCGIPLTPCFKTHEAVRVLRHVLFECFYRVKDLCV